MNPADIYINHMLPEIKISGLHFSAASLSLFVVGSEKQVYKVIECIMAIHGHLRSLILVPMESA